MKLKKVNIENYKSVAVAAMSIDAKLTTLVGANEHGKTNLLQAINLLDFKSPIKESDKRIARKPEKLGETSLVYELELNDVEFNEIDSKYREKLDASETNESSEKETSIDGESKQTMVAVKRKEKTLG